MTENEMVGWHHRLNGHEFEQAPGDGEGQESLACCSPWDHKELAVTERLNITTNTTTRDEPNEHTKYDVQLYTSKYNLPSFPTQVGRAANNLLSELSVSSSWDMPIENDQMK